MGEQATPTMVHCVNTFQRQEEERKKTPMVLLLITPLQLELDCLTRSLQARGFSQTSIQVGRMPVSFYPQLQMALAQGGHGKAQCALQTQHVLDCYDQVDGVICIGSSGALAPRISVGDLVVAETTIEHDFLMKFFPEPAPQFLGEASWLSRLKNAQMPSWAFEVHYGSIASGDEDIIALERAQDLYALTGALAVAWEGAGVARACLFSQVPFLEIRGITDTANHEAPAVFATTLSLAMDNFVAFIIHVRTTMIL
jgi:adenosylhomocysteine nucleosidase